ncbi:DNA-directed RNA polymerase subunit alpha [Candidatus Sumerlaeota bacterium]|nr:DNA-directed RNA polymerase subunit alpha [Candidatus Sumerlaeota bacterium]
MDFKTLIMPRSLHCDKATLMPTYGRFFAEPFERGYGVTIGNSLRRILLSSIQGAAPTAVRFAGVKHQFTAIDGVKEDISDIILNLKSLIFRLTEGVFETTLSLDVRGDKVVAGGDFEANHQVEILNPEQPIATLSKGARLQLELEIRLGRGYEPAEPSASDIDTIGIIPIDAVYSPVRNVKYTVEAARVGQRTDYDRLIMEVWTNGTISPEESILYAARVLRDHLSLFISIEEEAVVAPRLEEEDIEVSETAMLAEKLDKSIEELELSVRSFNCLEAAGIKTIRDLVQKTESEMLKYRNFGRKSLTEIKNILKGMGLSFNMTIDAETGLPVQEPADR